MELEGLEFLQQNYPNSDFELISTMLTIEISDNCNLINIYENWDSEKKFYFNSPHRSIKIGLGAIREIKGNNITFELAKTKIVQLNQRIFGGESNNLIWFGGKSFFDELRLNGDWMDWRSLHFVLPEITILKLNSNTIKVIFINEILTKDQLELYINKNLDEIKKFLEIRHSPLENLKWVRLLSETPHGIWTRYVNTGLGYIKDRVLEKIVLSRIRNYEINDFSILHIINQLEEAFPSTYTFDFQIEHGNRFFGATPELLINIAEGKITTYALAGSIPRGENNIMDQKLAEKLFNSQKNRKEHEIVVGDIKAKLNRFTIALEIQPYPSIVKLTNIQHLRTKINGDLKDNVHPLDLISHLHPTPALAGLPTEIAQITINEIEEHDRGWYGGPLGWFDSEGGGEFVVTIRSALLKGTKLTLYSGAGIVEGSVPEDEWEETNIKFLALERLFEIS